MTAAIRMIRMTYPDRRSDCPGALVWIDGRLSRRPCGEPRADVTEEYRDGQDLVRVIHVASAALCSSCSRVEALARTDAAAARARAGSRRGEY